MNCSYNKKYVSEKWSWVVFYQQVSGLEEQQSDEDAEEEEEEEEESSDEDENEEESDGETCEGSDDMEVGEDDVDSDDSDTEGKCIISVNCWINSQSWNVASYKFLILEVGATSEHYKF